MTIIELLYICSTTIAVLASIPQIRQLLITRCSDELSLTTWVLWLCTQFVSLTYAISIANILLACVNVTWIIFYITMVALIVRYRPRTQVLRQEVISNEVS